MEKGASTANKTKGIRNKKGKQKRSISLEFPGVKALTWRILALSRTLRTISLLGPHTIKTR